MKGLRGRGVLAIVGAILGLARLGAEGPATVAAWLAAPIGTSYATARDGLLAAAETARARGIPESLLVERLDEGALKRIEPSRLAAAIGQDLERFSSVLGLLDARGEVPGELTPKIALLRQGAILLRAGYGVTALGACMDGALARGAADPGPGGPAARALRAASVALDASLRFGLDGIRRDALGAALASSVLATDRLDAILSLFTKARGLGLAPDRASDLLVAGLVKGSSLEALDRELARRSLR